MDPVTAVGAVSKLIALGIKGWKALENPGFETDDLEALRALLDTGASTLPVFRHTRAPLPNHAGGPLASSTRQKHGGSR